MKLTPTTLDKLRLATPLKPGIYHINVAHDEGCPALKSERLADCTCDPDVRLVGQEPA